MLQFTSHGTNGGSLLEALAMRHAVRLAFVATLAMVGSGSSQAQEPKARPGRGPEHRVLDRMVGHWNFIGKIYSKEPGSEPTKVEGANDTNFLGESTWLVSKSKATGDISYEAEGIMCFDAEKGKYVSTGANSYFTPRLVLSEGTYDEASRTLSWKEREILEPGSGEKAAVKTETTFKDDDTMVTVGSIKRAGSEQFVKWYEITNSRRKGS
jgi:hypothetical protein